LLIDRRAAKTGVSAAAMTPLDRLALIGARSMGALVYEPETPLEPPVVVSLPELEADAQAVLHDARGPDLDRLLALGGSPHGARPKLLVQLAAEGEVIYGERKWRPGCAHYLIKFRALEDGLHAGTLEHAYLRMARAAGIDAPESRMLGRKGKHPGYFAVRRFDRDGARKVHLHTLCGLLHAPPRVTSLAYRDLLIATRQLTRNEAAVSEMFRRACFNVFAHNRDDHTRNFAYLMDEAGQWRNSPAYDLTFSEGPGGEHTLLVHDEGANPTEKHLRSLAASADVKRAGPIIEQVRSTVRRFRHFADEAGLPKRETERVARRLGLPAR
ncbi:MAG TPA: HipA domain-containing protein, partial [Myxococcaceae bacterium]|nr:HipA domain-containing protein [Myxococcaceae bacterium]